MTTHLAKIEQVIDQPRASHAGQQLAAVDPWPKGERPPKLLRDEDELEPMSICVRQPD